MVVNGATIRFRSKCRIELVSHARFLFGKQIMAAHEAETSIRRLYYLLQTAYVGPTEDREQAALDVHALFTELQKESAPSTAAALLEAEQAFASEDFYHALKILRTMLQNDRT